MEKNTDKTVDTEEASDTEKAVDTEKTVEAAETTVDDTEKTVETTEKTARADETEKKSAKKEKKSSFFKGLKTEYKKIVFADKATVAKQTVAVLIVSIFIGGVIAVLDMVMKFGLSFIF